MRRIPFFLPTLLVAWMVAFSAPAEIFKLKDGTEISGEPTSPNKDGVVFKYDSGEKKGRYSSRYKWEVFTQDALKKFPQEGYNQFTKFLIERTAEEMQEVFNIPKRNYAPISVNAEDSPKRAAAGMGMIAGMTSGAGLLLMALLYAANLYAGFEMGKWRKYGQWIGLALGAAPIAGPVALIFMPTRTPKAKMVMEEYDEDDEEDDEEDEDDDDGDVVEADVEVEPEPVVLPESKKFRRGEVNINRRFIENKLAGFFRVIPTENEKDLLVTMVTARGTFVGRRILKITNESVQFQVLKEADTTVDEDIPLNDILEIHIRHKDATD